MYLLITEDARIGRTNYHLFKTEDAAHRKMLKLGLEMAEGETDVLRSLSAISMADGVTDDAVQKLSDELETLDCYFWVHDLEVEEGD